MNFDQYIQACIDLRAANPGSGALPVCGYDESCIPCHNETDHGPQLVVDDYGDATTTPFVYKNGPFIDP